MKNMNQHDKNKTEQSPPKMGGITQYLSETLSI